MKLPGSACVGGHLIAALVLAPPLAAVAQARLAPPNPQQERCLEAFADTPEEKAMRDAIGEPPAGILESVDHAKGWEGLEALQRWGESRALEVFGSEEAARAAGEKIRIGKYTRRFELLRRNVKEGHLPSLYRLVLTSGRREYAGVPGAMGREEKGPALRTLYEHSFPLAPRMMAGECFEELKGMTEPIEPARPRGLDCVPRALYSGRGPHDDPPVGRRGNTPPICSDREMADHRSRQRAHGEAHRARVARWRAETTAKRKECLDLLREGGFRGDMRAWERLASYDLSHPTPPEVGIVPPIEHYAWLELEKMDWRSRGWKDRHNVPLKRQERLVSEFLSKEELREAVALAERYAEVLWPRRIQSDPCQLRPQFAGDPDPFASDLLPR